MNKKDEKIVIFDTETTGTTDEDRIVSFGAIIILNREITDKKIELFFNPQRAMNPEAAKITNISDDFLKDKPKFSKCLKEIEKFLEGADALIAHNASFDQNFLNRELKIAKAQYKIEDRFQIIDSLKLARERVKIGSYSLDRLCDYFQINKSVRDSGHGALIDAELLAKVYLKLTSEQREFNVAVEDKKKVFSTINVPKSDKTFKKTQISDEELALHNKIISSLKT